MRFHNPNVRPLVSYMSGWFMVDAPASFPFEWVAFLIPGLGGNNLKFIAVLKCIRLLRLGRLLKFFDHLQVANFARLVRLLAFFVLCTHWAGCCFWLLGTLEGMDEPGVWINEWGLVDEEFGVKYAFAACTCTFAPSYLVVLSQIPRLRICWLVATCG